MGDAFDAAKDADPEWWATRIVTPLAAVGLCEAATGVLKRPADGALPHELREQEQVLRRLTEELNWAWARYAATVADIFGVQNQVEDLVCKRVEGDVRVFFQIARRGVLQRIERDHRWYTGLQDGAKVVADRTATAAKQAWRWGTESTGRSTVGASSR